MQLMPASEAVSAPLFKDQHLSDGQTGFWFHGTVVVSGGMGTWLPRLASVLFLLAERFVPRCYFVFCNGDGKNCVDISCRELEGTT